MGPTGFGVDARGACSPWFGLCVCLLADWVGRRFLPGLHCPWLALLSARSCAHTGWHLAAGLWLLGLPGGLHPCLTHDCGHSGSGRHFLHYLLFLAPAPNCLTIRWNWIVLEDAEGRWKTVWQGLWPWCWFWQSVGRLRRSLDARRWWHGPSQAAICST